MTYIIYFIILSIISFSYYKYAQKANIIDNPNHRSSHTTPTIRGGGMVFFVAIILYFLWQYKMPYPYFFSGFLLLSILGFIDDKKELSAKIRFPFQMLAVGLILYESGLFTANIPAWIQVLAFVVAVGFINAFNFMDGINGITGFYTLAIILPLLYLNHHYKIFENDFFYVVLIAIIVFGFYNFRTKALMFAGDIGSMSLAAVILFWLTKMILELKSPLLLALVVVYGVDSALTILNRLRHKENIFEAHRWHIYQKFGDVWHWHHLITAFVYMFIQLLISMIVINYINLNISNQVLLLFMIYVSVSIVYVFLHKHFESIKHT